MIQAGSCCPTEPKLEPNHHGVLQVPRQEREAETEMEFVDDPLTNPDLVTQVRINTIQDLISLAGCQIILIDLNFHLQKCLEIFDKNSADKIQSKNYKGVKSALSHAN